MQYPKLKEPIKVGAFHLKNRVVMAPLTRGFADASGNVTDEITRYYERRAQDGIGLIISEGTIISPRAKGVPGVPGIYSDENIRAWHKVTDVVHNLGGTIICQIWHVGRLSHRDLIRGMAPLAPSSIVARGYLSRLKKPYSVPEEMTRYDIKEVVAQYQQAARNAISAGFDGVEIHGAHGYLIDQFASEVSNQRVDGYGGSLSNRLNFFKEVMIQVLEAIGDEKTVVRFSPHKVDALDYMWDEPEYTVNVLVQLFKEVGVRILHPSARNFDAMIENEMTLHELVRKYWKETIIGVGGLTPQRAEEAIQENVIDLAAFGRPIIANPDFMKKINLGLELDEYHAEKHLCVLV